VTSLLQATTLASAIAPARTNFTDLLIGIEIKLISIIKIEMRR
jgi:hypothetical protein